MKNNELFFESNEQGIRPVINCLKKCRKKAQGAQAFDKVVGAAAALLFVFAEVSEVNGLVGSHGAVKILTEAGIKNNFKKIVPKILNKDKTDLCPMEKLSAGKTPEEFFEAAEQQFLSF